MDIAIIGAGRVGVTIGALLRRAGHRISGCYARSTHSLERAALYLGSPGVTKIPQAMAGADTVILSVPDDALEAVVGKCAAAVKEGIHVVHTAGINGTVPLEPLVTNGAHTVAAHPLQTIPDVETGLARLPGSWFGVTCQPELKDWATQFVEDLRCKPLWINEADRTLYHAAAVISSNYLNVLVHLVRDLGMEPAAYMPLVKGAIANIETSDEIKSLTGPIARGDAGTIKAHLQALPRNIIPAYVTLGMHAIDVALSAKKIDQETAEKLRSVFHGR